MRRHIHELMAPYDNKRFFETSHYRVGTDIPPLALHAFAAAPHLVKLLYGGRNHGGLVGEDARLEVAVAVALHAHAGSCEIRGADIGGGTVEYHDFEVHTRAEAPFQFAPEPRVFVEVRTEVFARLLGVQQPNLHSAFRQLVKHRKERHRLPSTLNVQIFQVRGGNPQVMPDLFNKAKGLWCNGRCRGCRWSYSM